MINPDWKNENFDVGDVVYVANTILATTEPFAVRIVKVLEGAEAGNLGRHYVSLVVTHVDDFLRVDDAMYVWRSLEQRAAAANKEKERIKELKRQGEEIRKQFLNKFNQKYL